jgi:plasmid stability protein
MATLTIRNLDDDLMARLRLRLRAARHGQSMDEEACSILRAALANGVEDGSGASLYAAIRAYVDIRGRSRTLHINYRTSHQIRMQADRLLAPEVSDVDGNVEERRGTVSVFNGPRRRSSRSLRRMANPPPSATGCASASMTGSRRRSWACSCARLPNWIAPAPPWCAQSCRSKCWTTIR